MGVPAVRQARLRRPRALTRSSPDLARTYWEQFARLLEAVGPDRFSGGLVAEVGPGDAIPNGLLALAMGARRYIAIDRFLGDITGPIARGLYRDVLAYAPPCMLEGLRSRGLDPEDFPWDQGDGRPPVLELRSEGLEWLSTHRAPRVDLLFSIATLEHLLDVPSALCAMGDLVVPGGTVYHEVDYGPHADWGSYANPLSFLAVPDRLWRLSGSNRGMPNRFRHSELMHSLALSGFRCEATIGRRCTPDQVEALRPKLLPRFRHLPSVDLQVLSATIVGTREADAQPLT
jgi:hypothetical protein